MGNVRRKGHNWERKVVNDLKPIFPKAKTSRAVSLSEDAKGIDVVNTGKIAIQCKNYQIKPNFNVELRKMKTKKIKVLAFKWNKIRGNDGEFAVLHWEDFLRYLLYVKVTDITHKNENRKH